MSGFIKKLLLRVLEGYFENTIALAKIRAAGYYVKAVAEARRIFIMYVLFRFMLLLMLAGFVIAHVALFMYLPCSTQCAAIVMFVLGAFYFLVSLCVVLWMCSQKYWMRWTGAGKLVDKVTAKR